MLLVVLRDTLCASAMHNVRGCTMDRLECAARCQAVGYNSLVLSRAAGVSTSKARSWLDIHWDSPVPANAVFALTRAEDYQKTYVCAMIDLINAKTGDTQLAQTLQLPYWSSQEQLSEYNPQSALVDFRVVNACNVALSHILVENGYAVTWARPQKGVAYTITSSSRVASCS